MTNYKAIRSKQLSKDYEDNPRKLGILMPR